MSLTDTLQQAPVTLMEGAIIERLRRDTSVPLDPHIENAALVLDDVGRDAMTAYYRQYLDIGRDFNLPMLSLTPTWRANPERLRAAGHTSDDLNAAGVRMLQEIRGDYSSYASYIAIGGLIGCAGDAYDASQGLPVSEATAFHRRQTRELAAAGADFLMASTLPAVGEALGIAAAMAEQGVPYIISFVLRPTGHLLDDTPLEEAIAQIDRTVSPAPWGFMVNCVHPNVFIEAFTAAAGRDANILPRIIGLQANSSAKTPEELNESVLLDADEPEPFADAMMHARDRSQLKILGGCCGTDDRHIRAIGERVSEV